MNNKRRLLLQRSAAVGAIASFGLLVPIRLLAAYPKTAFDARNADSATTAAFGSGSINDSAQIKIKAPEVAENGAVVPITITTGLPQVSAIAILAEANNQPLVSFFNMQASTENFVSSRIKLAKSGNVVAVVKSDGKLFTNKAEVKVTIGGCGG